MNTSPEAHPMLLVDCPLCDGPAPFDAVEDTLDCDACGVVLEVATPEPVALPAAA
ncbi:MAG TPA: hypothetical protein VIZ22_11135 [Candidatus Limnocylindrales bacterium]